MKTELWRIIKFLFFGLLAVAIDYLTMSGVTSLSVNETVAKAIGYLAALAFTILFIQRVVFRDGLRLKPQLILTVYLISGFINVMAFNFLANKFVPIDVSFLAATGISATLNYSALRFFYSR